ncbi:prepilin-type N-terminal cleavage/methylation domain-containing protein [Planococcus sp. NCCP-2050]|uniref:type IV pilus modification PilV family protein n=1 Tax=Planococcus sp. NCCP-2050 TaxID=2944679 RepID=UPI00203E9A57|nr:prepilin-type N-terminal cleavage/methylation domain-containing protein [Planococcus sp. NCCP-2050]GKW46803.1 hypothetical protein NCCP2050_24950 [Planococcus sp. NCCP-2050]
MIRVKNESAISLVEVLATIVILSIVSALAYSLLFQGYSNYQRIQAETELRDEADLIMASFIYELFTLKTSEVKTITSACTNNSTTDSFLSIKKNNTLPISDTGFKTGNVSGIINQSAVVNGKIVQFNNKNVKLVPNKCGVKIYNSIVATPSPNPTESAPREYTIKFRLETFKGKTPHSLDFENTVQIIDDTKEAKTSATTP